MGGEPADHITTNTVVIKSLFCLSELEIASILHHLSTTSPLGVKRNTQFMGIISWMSKHHVGSGCGSVGRVVASDTRGPRFKSSHRQKFIYILNICLLSTVYWKEKNKEKEAGYGPFFKKHQVESSESRIFWTLNFEPSFAFRLLPRQIEFWITHLNFYTLYIFYLYLFLSELCPFCRLDRTRFGSDESCLCCALDWTAI